MTPKILRCFKHLNGMDYFVLMLNLNALLKSFMAYIVIGKGRDLMIKRNRDSKKLKISTEKNCDSHSMAKDKQFITQTQSENYWEKLDYEYIKKI